MSERLTQQDIVDAVVETLTYCLADDPHLDGRAVKVYDFKDTISVQVGNDTLTLSVNKENKDE